jgi:hypothetical protein
MSSDRSVTYVAGCTKDDRQASLDMKVLAFH